MFLLTVLNYEFILCREATKYTINTTQFTISHKRADNDYAEQSAH